MNCDLNRTSEDLKLKIELGARNCLYPMPTTLVGATVKGRPNFITIAHVGIMDLGSVSLGMAKAHYTNAGIKENGTFSINLPAADMVEKTDYCGLVSGMQVDKAKLFHIFYGDLKTAPMIAECPIAMECRLTQVVDFPNHDVFIGEIVASYAEDTVLTDGAVDYSKVRPLLFTMPGQSYWELGNRYAKAWNIGKGLKKGKATDSVNE
jgi:flavin reductase (DIM6/NTAB) family NADH-FMN oxidoreductase RutF